LGEFEENISLHELLKQEAFAWLWRWN